jgi:protein-disulfide isomerase
MKTHIIFGLTVLVLIAAFMFGSSYYKGKQAEKFGFMAQENASTFVRDHSQTLGSDDAKVYLVEFMDPACETCAAFSPFVKQMIATNPGKIKLVLRYAPFHDGADYFVKILEAAKKQGKYWETLNVMYKSQPYWASHSNPQPQRIWQFLPQAGVNVEQIRRDMNDPAIAKLIEQDLADAKTLNVRKTPGFFVNGRPLQTFGSKQLLQLVQSEIRANYPNPN